MNPPRDGRQPLHVALLAALAAGLVGLPWLVGSASHLNLVILVLMAAQIGVAWNIVGGYAGQVSLGHTAFFGLGAYVTSVLLLRWGINPWLGTLAGGVVAVLASVAFGWSCFRLKGHYFAMATIAVAEILQIVFTNWDFAGGAVGLTLPIDRSGWTQLIFNDKRPYYWVALALLALTLLANVQVERSFLGYYLRAVKDEPDAARSVGIDIGLYKQVALAISAFFTALGGSLYALKELYIDPASVLSTGISIKMALVSILGGIGTLFGPVLGAVVLTSVEEVSRAWLGGSGRGTDLIIYASLIIAIAVFYPNGLIGWYRSRRARLASSRRPEASLAWPREGTT